MKKNFWVLLSAAMAMLSTTSCSKDETAKDSFETIEATVEVSEEVDGWTGARSLIYDTEDGGIELWWGTSEAIGVYGTRLTNKKFTGTNKYKNATTTTFSGATLFSSPKYAYYPYSADNNSSAQSAVKGNLPAIQTYSTTIRRLNHDYKIGQYASWSFSGSKFTFSNMLTYVRPRVDVTGSVLEGDKLEYINMEVTTADGQPRQISGDFTFDLTQVASSAITAWTTAEGTNVARLSFSDTPTLQANQLTEGFLTLGPNIKKGDVIKFTLKTDKHIATFNRTSGLDYAANKLVKYTITLMSIADLKIEDIVQEQPEPEEGAECVLNSMKFTVANNPGKILARNFTHNSSFTVTVGKDKTEEVATIDEENKKITLYVPYLNNRKLVPTFEIPEGTQLVYEGGEIISGETEVDFATYKQVAVINAVGDAVVYDVELTNTGLPVVVVNQATGVTSTELDNEYKKASAAWYAATNTKWVPKDNDWPEPDVAVDNFMVYNADGTIAMTDKKGNVVTTPVASATRIRGNVTQQMPKKSFAVKLDSKSGVLDMPAHKRWVLLANWKDRTLMRNEVAFEIAKAFKTAYPNDGMAWNPSGQHVELVYNGVHVGTYYLCEQIKIDENRLNINDPYDAEDAYSGNAEDYGILMESDDGYDEAWQFTTRCRIPFLFKDDGTADMLTYASTLVQGIEDNLNKNTAAGFTEAYKTMDITSFVDFLLVQDLMMNSEMKHPKSCYSYINNGKLYAGPVWDFDWNTLPTSTSYSEEGYSYTKSIVSYGSWSYQSRDQSSPSTSDENYIWYPRLMASSEFMDVAKTRWAGVQGQLSQVLAHIDEVKAQIAKSEEENAKMWPVDSKSNAKRSSKYGIGSSFFGQTFSCGYCGDEAMEFDAAVNKMKETLSTRMSGMSNNIYK